MAPGDDVRVLEDTERHFEDGTVLRARVLAVPESEKYPEGVKYRLHYGTEDGTAVVRYDNFRRVHSFGHFVRSVVPSPTSRSLRSRESHGVHERHTSEGLDDDYEFPGYDAVQDRFWTEVRQHRDGITNP